jgi:hypothetical protein
VVLVFDPQLTVVNRSGEALDVSVAALIEGHLGAPRRHVGRDDDARASTDQRGAGVVPLSSAVHPPRASWRM